MAAIIKTTHAFFGQAQGWSESYYWLSTDGNLQTAEILTTPLAQKRASLLASGYVLQVIRNEVVQNPVGTPVLRVSDLAEPGFQGNPAWGPGAPQLALLCSWQTANNLSNKKQYLRGIPGDLGDMGKTANFGNPTIAGFYSNFLGWAAAMQNFSAGWLKTSVSGSAVITEYVVDPVTAQVEFTVVPNAGFAFPSPVGLPGRVYVRLPGKNPLDGPLTVVPINGTSCFTPGSHPAAPLPTGQVGYMMTRTASLVQMTPVQQGVANGGIFPERIVSHKTGRPTYASRGRSAVKSKW